MDELRLSLLVLCVVLIVGIYVRELMRKRNARVTADGETGANPASQSVHEEPQTATRAGSEYPDPLLDDAHAASPSVGDAKDLVREDARYVPESEAYMLGDGPARNADAEPPLAEWRQDADDVTGLDEHRASDTPGARRRGDDDIPLGDIDLLSTGGANDRGTLDVAADGLALPEGNADGFGELVRDADVQGVSGKAFQQGQLDLDGRAPGASKSGTVPATGASLGARESAEELLIMLHVMQPDRRNFDGRRVRGALTRAGLYFGEMNIFHHYGLSPDAGTPVFSIAKAIEPGTFSELDDNSFETPGLTIFMRLPGPEDGTVVLELMFAAAQSLARELDGQVLDEARSTLSAQSLNHLRDRVIDFNRLQRVPSAST